MINVRHKSKDRAECGNYRGILLVAHAGKVLLEIVATRLSVYCEAKELLLEEQCRSHPVRHRSITDKIFAVRRPQELGKERTRAAFPVFYRPGRHTTLSIAHLFCKWSLTEYDRRW